MSDLPRLFTERRWLLVGVAGTTVVFPPLGFFGAAALGLATLRRGQTEGLLLLLLAAVLAGSLRAVFGGQFAGGMMLAAVTLLPVTMLALVLRWRQSLNLTIQLAALVGCGLVLLVSAAMPEHGELWRGLFERLLDQAAAENGLSSAEREQMIEQVNQVPFELMTGAVVANMLLASLAALFLARSWQARLVNPGGFQREFHHLRLGQLLAWGALLVLFAALLTQAAGVTNLAIVLMAAWMLQGLALVHYTARARQWSIGWLISFYVVVVLCLLTASPLLLLVCFGGLLDQFFNLRQRVSRQATDDRSGPGPGQE